MLVSGELKDCPLEPTDTDSICKTYAGRGWTVIDTMGFGEPLDDTIPDKYVKRMGIDFLNEVKGCYSLIIFVVNEHDIDTISIPFSNEDDKCTMSIIWKIFLEIFVGGEENYVVVVTKRTERMWLSHNRAEMDQKVKEMFPQCKKFLYTDFKSVDPEMLQNDGENFSRIEDLEMLEKEMKKMFKASPKVEIGISKMGDEEIKDMVAKIAHQLTSKLASNLKWGALHGSTYEKLIFFAMCFQSDTQILEEKVDTVSRVQNEMQNLRKEVKFYRSQCEYLFQRSMEASKKIHDLFDGTKANLDERHLKLLITSLAKFVSCLEAARKLLHFCGDSKEEEEASLILSSPTVSGRNVFSKFAMVLRDLDWSLDVFCFWWYNPKAQGATESECQLWFSKFLWSEASCRLVYVGNGKKKIVDTDSIEANVVADNNRQAQDQQDLILSMESHFQNPKRVENGLCGLFSFPFRKKILKQLSDSEMLNYMSILKNRLEGNLSLEAPGMVPSCFQIPGDQKFKAIQFIGRGSYKEVFKSKWLRMNVAVATFKCGQGGASKTIIEGEARLLARVQHPNVVTFIGYSYDEEKQQGFLVTELLERSLRSLMNKSKLNRPYSSQSYPFTINEAIDILLHIVEAMIHVHECGVIHRDLKAENCLINLEFDGMGLYVGVVKLIDFGTSELQSTEMGSNFKTPNVGTPPWMAPEVYGKIGDEVKLYTWSVDVYSFGMTCYEVVTGKVPFGTIRGCALRELVCDGHRPTIPSNCPHDLKNLMMKCWAHNPEDRPTFKNIRQSLWNLKLYYLIQKI
jgi:hypothetical protein